MSRDTFSVYVAGVLLSLVTLHKNRGRQCAWYDVAMTGIEALQEAIAQLRGHDQIDAGLREALAPLPTYDAEHNADLAHTLVVFVQLDGNVGATAERLFLHRNSVAYRLQRIEEVCGLDVRDARLRLLLMTALSLADPGLLQELEPEGSRDEDKRKE